MKRDRDANFILFYATCKLKQSTLQSNFEENQAHYSHHCDARRTCGFRNSKRNWTRLLQWRPRIRSLKFNALHTSIFEISLTTVSPAK